MKIKSGNWMVAVVFVSVAYLATAVTLEDFTLGLFSSRHDHDGLYISNQGLLGFNSAWVISGSNIRVIQNGSEQRRWIEQGNDYIKINNSGVESYFYLNEEGEFVVADKEIDFLGTSMDIGLRMVKVKEETNYTVNEVMVLLDSAYGD
ncbi:hypothetical protein [Ekhidna sp.]